MASDRYAAAAFVVASLGLKAALGISAYIASRPRLKRCIELTLAIHALGCSALISSILLLPCSGEQQHASKRTPTHRPLSDMCLLSMVWVFAQNQRGHLADGHPVGATKFT
jgi:hypothetical protein